MLHAVSSVIFIWSPCLARSTHYKALQFVFFSFFLLLLSPEIQIFCALPSSHTPSIFFYCESYGVINVTRWLIMWWVTPIQNSPCNCSFVCFNLDVFRWQIERQHSEVKSYGDSRIQSTVHLFLCEYNYVFSLIEFPSILTLPHFQTIYWVTVYYDILGFLHELFSPYKSSSSTSNQACFKKFDLITSCVLTPV